MKVFRLYLFRFNSEIWALPVSLLCLCPLFNLGCRGEVAVSRNDFHGRDSYVLENELIQLRMLTGGGYIGELRFKSDDPLKSISPLRVPHYRTIEPQDYDPKKHDALYGGGGDRRVMAGYMGQFLCFPYFGGTNSTFEKALGYEAHGEAVVEHWNVEPGLIDQRGGGLESQAQLPLSGYTVRRRLTMNNMESVVLVEEEVENLKSFDRPYQWVHHVTFGSPFVEYEKTYVDAPVAGIAFSSRELDHSERGAINWPNVRSPNGELIDAGVSSVAEGEGAYRAWLMDSKALHTWFTVYHQDYHILVGYVFSRSSNPWIADWQENGSKNQMPWDGKAIARGLLVGTSPFTPGVRRSIERGPILETPTHAWIGAAERKKQSYMIFLAEIEKGFRGVLSLRVGDGAITMIEKETMNEISVSTQFAVAPQGD